jgi:hypothetical protein
MMKPTATLCVPATMLCSLRHPLQQGGLSTNCCICDSSDAPAVMHCPECKDAVCGECLPKYKDIGFAMYLKNENGDSLYHYLHHPEYAMQRYRSPYAVPVYDLSGKYNNTAEYRETLRRSVDRVQQDITELQTKLSTSAANQVTAPLNKGDSCYNRCSPLHTLKVGALPGNSFCILCMARGKPVPSMYCIECKDVVCEECVPKYKDVGFAMFLSRAGQSSLYCYERNPDLSTKHKRCGRNEEQRVYDLHAEYHNTDEHRDILRQKIEAKKREMWEKRCELAAAVAAAK